MFRLLQWKMTPAMSPGSFAPEVAPTLRDESRTMGKARWIPYSKPPNAGKTR
jgi:hypothetical protein